MLQDFLLIECYFGPPEAAQNYEEALRKYGEQNLESALRQGFLKLFHTRYGRTQGQAFCALTDKGRLFALDMSS